MLSLFKNWVEISCKKPSYYIVCRGTYKSLSSDMAFGHQGGVGYMKRLRIM